MGMGPGGTNPFREFLQGRVRYIDSPDEPGAIPVGASVPRTQAVYKQPTQTSEYENPIPQYMPARFNPTPYGQAYEQQFAQNMQGLGQNLPPVQSPGTVSGLGALAQLYGMYNAAPQNAEAQASHAASLAAAANTPI